LDENEAITITDPTTTEDVGVLAADKAALEIQIGYSLIDPVGITQNQDDAKAAVSKYIFETICAPSMRYARNVGDHDLEVFFKHTEAMMFKYSLTALGPLVDTLLAKALLLFNTVPAYVTSTGMTVLKVTGGTNLNIAYKGWLGKAKIAEKAVNAALVQIDVIQKRIWDVDFPNLMNDSFVFSTSHPAFGPGLAIAMKIDDLPTEHTQIQGFGHDAEGNVLIGMTVTNLDLPTQLPMVTSNVGFYHDDTFQWGVYRYQFSMPGKITQIITEEVLRGRTSIINVVLLNAPPPPPVV